MTAIVTIGARQSWLPDVVAIHGEGAHVVVWFVEHGHPRALTFWLDEARVLIAETPEDVTALFFDDAKQARRPS